MTAHTKDQREFIALRLARFETPLDICAAFMATWRDTYCTPTDVASCDPAQGGILAPETLEKFLAARERILTDPASTPAADRRVRLFILNQELEKARSRNAIGTILSILTAISLETSESSGGGPASGQPHEVQRITRTIVDPKNEDAAA